MAEYTGFSEASLLYADNYYLVARLQQVFKSEQTELFQALRQIIEEREWITSGKWRVNISGTYFELIYQRDTGKEPFYINLRLGPREVANKNKEEGKEGDRRTFEIVLTARTGTSDISKFRTNFFKRGEAGLKEEFELDTEYQPKRMSGQSLVRREVEYNMPNLLNMMESELDRFVKIAQYAEESLEANV